MNEIKEATSFALHPDAAYTFIDNEAVIMGPEDDTLYGLNAIGTELLRCLESKKMSLQSLADYLFTQFDVTKNQSVTDTKNFMQSMLSYNLIIQVS